MSTKEQKTALLQEFQNYLQQNQPELYTTQEQPDLHTLLSELTGLKTEVKAESRQFKNTLDTLATALDTVQADNKSLVAELAASDQRLEQQQAEMLRTILMEMVELYDRVHNGLGALENYQPVNALFKHSQKKDVRFIQRFKEGQQMTLRRFEQLLQQNQVRPIDCVGLSLDPLLMSAVEVVHESELANGVVLEELRKGFLYKDQVLRLAEVKVNKIKAG